MSKPVFAAFFKGAGLDVAGTLGDDATSAGIDEMAAAARAAGIGVGVFSFDEENAAVKALQHALNIGQETAAIGFSAGAGTVTAISRVVHLDLAELIDPSRDCINYRLYAPNVVRSILFHNNNWFSRITGVGGAGEKTDPGGDLGAQIKYEIDENHLVVDLDRHVQDITHDELLRLQNGAG